jgi:hypothetical protein
MYELGWQYYFVAVNCLATNEASLGIFSASPPVRNIVIFGSEWQVYFNRWKNNMGEMENDIAEWDH